jgi:hypothetical protein
MNYRAFMIIPDNHLVPSFLIEGVQDGWQSTEKQTKNQQK